jgi:hydroxymethylglutaryl-CoA lyase
VEEGLRLIGAVTAAGVTSVEVGSFVSPKAVPAMAGTDAVVAALPTDGPVHYTVLIPNLKGYELARAAGACSVTMVLYASEGMARKNVHVTMAEAEAATAAILAAARADGIEVIAANCVAFACPIDGPTDPGLVRLDVDRRLVTRGGARRYGVVIGDDGAVGEILGALTLHIWPSKPGKARLPEPVAVISVRNPHTTEMTAARASAPCGH